MHSYDIFMLFLLFAMLVFALFWDRYWKPFWLVLGSTSGAMGGQKVIKMSSTIDATIGIEKSRFRGRPIGKKCTGLVARMGVRGEVNLLPGVRRFGRKEKK